MNPQLDSTRTLARAATEPDMTALRNELALVLAQAGAIRERQQTALNTRLNRWDGQSDDSRKHEADIGEAAKPFEGAPDLRVPVIDTVTRERVALYVESLMSGDIQAQPIGGLDQGEQAVKISRRLRWLRDNMMQSELRSEAELLGNYVEGDDPGIGVLKVWWRREAALELRELSLDEVGLELLKARGVQPGGDGSVPPGNEGAITDVGDLIFNNVREDEGVDLMKKAFPSVQPVRLRKSLRQLRKTGSTALPLPYVKENRPCVAALRYMHDVFFPSDIDDIQRARVIWEREWLTEAELRGKEHTESWDPDFIEAVIDKGPGGGELDGFSIATANTWARAQGFTSRTGDNEITKLYEIWHAFSKAADDYGITGVYWTVFSAKVEDYYGYHELLDYPHGLYPYVDFRSERISRGMENARGTPERGGSLQFEIKRMRDSRGAHEMLSTVPPIRVTQRRGGLEAVLGPMVEVPVRQPDDVTYLTPPQFPQASMEMEKSTWNDLNQYFGRMVSGQPSDLGQAILQNDVNRWLNSWKTVWTMIQELDQEFSDPQEMALVTGGQPDPYAKEQIRGRYTTFLAFSVRDLNMEFVVSRNNAIAAVLQQDMGGIIDRTPIIRAGLRAIDPSLAEQSIRDAGVVTQKEVDDEKGAVNMLANGIEAPLRQGGVNAQLRLQTLQQTVMGSPTLARRYQQPQTPDDEVFKKLVENRLKNLQFLVQQYTVNPQIGHQGTMAMQSGAGAAGAAQQ